MSNNVTDEDRAAHALVNVRLDAEQQEWVQISEDGVLDMPISVVRQLSDWLRRYDLRPKNGVRRPQ